MGQAPRRNPVILVHGILGQRHLYWNLFRNRLARDGHVVHEAVLPYYMLGDIRIAARFLRDKVEATLRGDGAQKVDLVCHSAGGLVARYYLKYLDGARHVGHVVTLGTPHRGTYFAYLIGIPFVDITSQTRPGSHFLKEIDGAPRGVRITSIWSPVDGVVLPAENAILPGARNVKVTWTSHWGFLWARDVYDKVREALADAGSQRRLDANASALPPA